MKSQDGTLLYSESEVKQVKYLALYFDPFGRLIGKENLTAKYMAR